MESGLDNAIFQSPLRRFHHSRRFLWAAKHIPAGSSILEIGFGHALVPDFIPTPRRYLGLEGNPECLAPAKAKFPQYEFGLALSSDDIPNEQFDVSLCLETLEHMPDEIAEGYIAKMAQVSKLCLITVPVESGISFTIKEALKKLAGRGSGYSPKDFLLAATFRPGRLKRVDFGMHYGFDYRNIIRHAQTYFSSVKVCGVFPGIRPLHANLNIGIIASGAKNANH
jgi:hypothetical protein